MPEKKKTSFVDAKELELRRRMEEARKRQAENPSTPKPNQEESLFPVLRELIGVIEGSVFQLCRIADILEGSPSSRTVKSPTTKPPATTAPRPKVVHEVKRYDDVEKTTPSTPKPTEKPEPTEAPEAYYVKQVRNLFPPTLSDLLNVTDGGDFIKIQVKEYLGAENYAKVAKTVQDYNGSIVSGVKEGDRWKSYPYFRIDNRDLE